MAVRSQVGSRWVARASLVTLLAIATASGASLAVEESDPPSEPASCVSGASTSITRPDADAVNAGTSPIVSTPFAAADDGAEPARMAGRWRKIARSPFAGHGAAGAWTGRLLVVVDPDTRRSASYDPETNEWNQGSRAPHSFDSFGPSVWTGEELIVPALDRVRPGAISGLAYDPEADEWRELASATIGGGTGDDRALNDAVWTGDDLVALTSDRRVAVYHPNADCWDLLPPVATGEFAWHVYSTGSSILAETRGPEGVAISAFDHAANSWSEPAIGPLALRASQAGASWVEGKLIWINWRPRGEEEVVDASFDPTTGTWEALSLDCITPASEDALDTGSFLLSDDGLRAIDLATGHCVATPRPPHRLGSGDVLVWTGRDVISWSGILGDGLPSNRTGLAYRIPAAE